MILYYFPFFTLVYFGTLAVGKKSYLLARLANSAFQMTWLYEFSVIFPGISAWNLGLLFFTGHLPAFFVKHLSGIGRAIVLVTSLLGGLLGGLLISFYSGSEAIILLTLGHFVFYAVLRPLDRRLKLDIVN
jgi:hypothetical protein